PLWRRDGRCLLGCALGMVLGLGVIPAAALGPAKAWDCNLEFAEVLLLPGLGLGTDRSRADELTNVTATDSQSILAVLHNTLHPDRWTRPPQASPAVRLTSLAASGLLLLVLLATAR